MNNILNLISENKILRLMLNVPFPRRCPYCDDATSPFGAYICKDCKRGFKIASPNRCFKCGKPLYGRDENKEFCFDCSVTPHFFDRGYSLFDYKSAAKSIYRFKYTGRKEYAEFYARCFAGFYAEEKYGLRIKSALNKSDICGIFAYGKRIEALIPVPLHEDKKRSRGYNQAELFARELSKISGTPVRSDLVFRTKATSPQKGLGAVMRRENLKNAFNIRSNDVSLGNVAVVDDIYTTGSTVDAVSALLRAKGAENIHVFTLAIGVGKQY